MHLLRVQPFVVAILSVTLQLIIIPVVTSAANRVVAWADAPSVVTAVPASVTNVLAIAAGDSFSLALKADGTVLAWGQAGRTNVPAGLSNVVAIAATGPQSLALKNDGTLVAWGTPSSSVTTNVPAGLSNIVAIACGDAHNLVLREDGKIFAWGANYSGQTNLPANLSNVVAIATGNSGNLAIKADGTAWGSGTFTNRLTGYSNLVTGTLVASGNSQGAVLRGDGSAFIWGYPYTTTTNLPNVIALAGRSGFNQAGALWALRRDGTLVGFGAEYLGDTNVYPKLTNVLAVAIGSFHHVAIVGDGFPLPIAPVTQFGYSNRRFTVEQPTVRGRSYILEYQNANETNGWQQLPPVPGTGQTRPLTDPAAATVARFYRVRVSP